MITPKVRFWLYIIGQILAQSAVIAVIPEAWKPLTAALAAIIGTILAFRDPSTGMAKAISNLERTGSVHGKKR